MDDAEPIADLATRPPLLFARVLDGKGGARPAGWEEVQHWHPQAHEPVLWLHLDRTAPGIREWLEDRFAIPLPTIDLLTSEASRPRAFHEGHALVATLRGINFNPGAEPEDMVSMQLWARDHVVLTLRRRQLQTPKLVRDALDAGRGPDDAGGLVTTLTEHLVDRMSETIIELNAEIDRLDDENCPLSPAEVISAIADIRRSCLALKRHMSPQHEALENIARDAPDWFERHDRRQVAETIDRLRRFLDDIDISKESALVLQDDLRARAAAQTQQTQNLLTIVAGIFLPLSFITGLLGINVGDIPLATPGSHGFWIIVMLCIGIFAVELAIARKLKWF